MCARAARACSAENPRRLRARRHPRRFASSPGWWTRTTSSWDAERALADRRRAGARGGGRPATTPTRSRRSMPLEAAFAVKRCRRGGARRSATETKETRSEPARRVGARACLDVARADTRSTSTALARARARSTPAGRRRALRLLSLGAKPSVSYQPEPSPVAISSSGGDGGGRGEDAVEIAARRHASTAAHVAARANNWRVLARMLDLDATGVLGARDGEGYPALHVAITARARRGDAGFGVAARADPEIEVCVNAGRERERDRSRPVTGRGRAVRVNAFELAARSGDDRVVDAAFAGVWPSEDEEKKATKKKLRRARGV